MATGGDPVSGEGKLAGIRLAGGYAVVALFLITAVGLSLGIGADEHAAPGIAGIYETQAGGCFGNSFRLNQSGEFVDLEGPGPAGGELRLRHRRLVGDVTCADGSSAEADLAVRGAGTDVSLAGTAGGQSLSASFAEELPKPGEAKAPAKKRSGEETFGRLMLAVAAFILNTSVAFPLALGLLAALPIYEILAPDTDYVPFALFMGVSMSVTALPVLARILSERRMLKCPVGALAMTSAAI